ncbi:MAG: UDP-3-O-(3-hydroxymyristoyl)glucosamine N-acyltransferase [Gammaproteobacteria bacterium]|nr:UDP-3-O-(3-hydroxymyristoyl)glucosamine N-acyltransferase [Gammaproteobacteria bacterium]
MLARTLGELAVQFGCELIGDPEVSVTRVATLSNAGSGDLSFFANKNYRDALLTTRAGVVVARQEDADTCPVPVLVSEDPYLTYAYIAASLHPSPLPDAGIHESATVAASANLAAGVHVSANAFIDGDVDIGENVYVGPGVVIGPGCRVGAESRLLANATLVRDVVLGARCIVHSGAVLGSDGFGNTMSESGWVKVPQVGGVCIGNDVEIGANTTVDRGAIDDTTIEDGVRIDNLVQIGHNVRVGAHTAMAACVAVSGSTSIGKRCMIGGRAGFVGHITICDDVLIGGAAVVSKDITEPGAYSGAFMAEKDRDWKRRVARFRRLGDLAERVTALEKSTKGDS